MAEHKLVRVRWQGPFEVDEALRMNDAENDYGLYQVYGQHPVFGTGSLLYIGMARDQTFAARIGQHDSYWLRDECDVSIRMGRLWPEDYRHDDEWKEWGDLLSAVEALTIYYHAPPYNSKNIWDYHGPAIWIQSWGARGGLAFEYSSHWKVERPRD